MKVYTRIISSTPHPVSARLFSWQASRSNESRQWRRASVGRYHDASKQTCSLAVTVSAPSRCDGRPLPKELRLYFDQTQTSSVLSAFNLRRLADISCPTSVIESSSRATPVGVSPCRLCRRHQIISAQEGLESCLNNLSGGVQRKDRFDTGL